MIKRILTTAAASLALGGALLATTAATAGTTPPPSSHALMRAIVTGATVGIDGTTYAARPMGHDSWTPGDKRLCAEFTFPRTHANVPTTRELAVDATDTNGWLRTDTEALVTYALAGQRYGAQWRQVKRDCSY